MRSIFNVAATVLGLTSTLATASPAAKRGLPLADGFPNPNPTQLKQIQQNALGTLPNGPPPSNISSDGLVSLRLVAANELFEVAFFSDLLNNVTQNVKGYEIAGNNRDLVIKSLTAVLAQEELHALNANNALAHFNAGPIQPCKYKFPVSDFNSSIKLAATFTSLVLGTLQDVIKIFAERGDVPLTVGVASVVGQEGEQEGWYRLLQGKVPSELPFLTTSTREFAFNALNQNFIVPGSCPNINTIKLTAFQPLTLLSQPMAKTEPIQFSFQKPATGTDNLKLVYINQQKVPIVEDITVVKTVGSTVTIQATFPYDANEMNGLTIAAVVGGSGPFQSAQDVASATKFGPALIIIN
ncbi:hypothetical protein Egran_06906 [Elaphomyces granulatus]|uniref:Late sexual development protein n=1 Tax=Elaphomyces granulatus TaxID=519963 RepID=A0A232LME8_9EURO|nr:hypothetical protein Egran_06906 [Elaphomyces granulatus]